MTGCFLVVSYGYTYLMNYVKALRINLSRPIAMRITLNAIEYKKQFYKARGDILGLFYHIHSEVDAILLDRHRAEDFIESRLGLIE